MGIQHQQHAGTACSCPRPHDSAGHDAQHVSARLDELRRLVNEHVVSAEATWPGVKVSHDDFLAFLSPCVTQERPLAESVGRLAIRDLYLACAALADNKAAVAVLDDLAGEVAYTMLARVGVADCVVDEVRQEYFVRLLFGSPSTAALLQQYRGQAPLRSWLRLMMVRRVVRMKKREKKNRPYEEQILEGLALDSSDPELSYLKAHYVQEFRVAFNAALGELEPRDRNILRYLVVDGMKVRELADFFGVNRVTVSKQLRNIRRRLLKKTRHGLSVKLRASPDDVDSIMRLIRSRLEITLGCLAEQAEPPEVPS